MCALDQASQISFSDKPRKLLQDSIWTVMYMLVDDSMERQAATFGA